MLTLIERYSGDCYTSRLQGLSLLHENTHCTARFRLLAWFVSWERNFWSHLTSSVLIVKLSCPKGRQSTMCSLGKPTCSHRRDVIEKVSLVSHNYMWVCILSVRQTPAAIHDPINNTHNPYLSSQKCISYNISFILPPYNPWNWLPCSPSAPIRVPKNW